METEPPACGNDRMRDNYTPLWRIALALGNPWPQRLAAAYAAHAADGEVRAHLQMAAVFAFGHGLALATLAPHAVRTLARIALGAMLLGVLCFSGSVAAAHFLGTPTSLAPFGGSLMILSWLVFAIDALRR